MYDIQYHDIRSDVSLFRRFGNSLVLNQRPADILRACTASPPDTRAAIRGAAIERAAQLGMELRMDWDTIQSPNGRLQLPDPLQSNVGVIDAVLPVPGTARKGGRSADAPPDDEGEPIIIVLPDG